MLSAQVSQCETLWVCSILHLLAGPGVRKNASQATSSSWHAMLAKQAASALARDGDVASGAAGASGILETAQHQPGSGYAAHPAALDASLHLGASLGAAPGRAEQQKDGRSGAALVRVPSALGAFWAARHANVGECWAAAGNLSAQPASAALSSYWLQSGTGAAGHANLSGLLAKPLKATAALGSETASQQAAADSGMLYSMQWKAVAPAPGGAGRRKPAHLTWHHLGQHVSAGPAEVLYLRAPGTSRGAHALQASAGTLAIIQQLLAGRGGRAGGLRVSGTCSSVEDTVAPSVCHSLQHSVALAGAGALLRTAAQEHPSMDWQAHGCSSWQSQHGGSAAVPDSDAFGLQSSRSAHYRPQMLPAATEEPMDTAAMAGSGGCTAITGGLGSIGMLAGLWAAEQGSHVQLLGRSGRTQTDALPLLARATHATVMRCDVGSSEEAAQLRASSIWTPLRQVWHAGGVLQDATLPKQTLSLLRAVAVPKLDGIMRLSEVFGHGTPVDAVTLFSSTAALLGPPGQGNYAAANAQLNAWSQATQSAGRCSNCSSRAMAVLEPGCSPVYPLEVQQACWFNRVLVVQPSRIVLALSMLRQLLGGPRAAERERDVGSLGRRHGCV